MGRNIELLERTMQHILDHPEDHNQLGFLCGTAGCFAGWALRLAGVVPMNCYSQDVLPVSQGWGVAQDLLGLTNHESIELFSTVNTIDDLQYKVKALVNGEDI